MAAYARTPSVLKWLRANHLINGLHNQISCKNCSYANNSYGTIVGTIVHGYNMVAHSVTGANNSLALTIVRR